MARSPWKPFYASFPPGPWAWRPPSCYGRGFRCALRNTPASEMREASSSGFRRIEGGFLLVALAPVVLLMVMFLLGSLKLAALSQEKAALQSRLDLCAVRLAATRERLFQRLARTNQALKVTVLGIYAARAARLGGPIAAAAGAAGELALLRANHALALLQSGYMTAASATETRDLSCRASPYSEGPAFCQASPSLLSALERERTLYHDVRGHLVHRRKGRLLAEIRCRGAKGLSTALQVRGDPELAAGGFHDIYVR